MIAVNDNVIHGVGLSNLNGSNNLLSIYFALHDSNNALVFYRIRFNDCDWMLQ